MAFILKVKDLGFNYKEKKVLKDINFNLNKGEFVGILGPNGSGKTTLLNNINNWLKPFKGKVLVENVDIKKYTVKELARNIATVPQNIFTTTFFTVEQIVMMGRNPYLKRFGQKNPKDFEIVKKAMMSMNVWDLRHKPINTLSGGERQRVVIAKALAQEPRLLLLDEPTSHLDIKYQWEILNQIKKLCDRDNLTVLSVLHDINIACMFCDKIILLKDHKIYQMGTIDEVITEENLYDVFNVKVKVKYNWDNRRPVVIFINDDIQLKEQRTTKIHVICGGGEGKTLLKYLHKKGFNVTLGVLNIGDSDWNTGKLLGFDIVEEKPFSPLTDEKINKNKDYILQSDIVVVANIPFGYGNLKNLLCVKEFIGEKDIYIIEENDIVHRDYTSGKATKIYNDIKKHAHIFTNVRELMNYLDTKHSLTIMEGPYGQSKIR